MPIKKKTTKAPAKKATALGPKAKLMKLQVTTLRNKAKKLGISNVTTRTKENLAQSIILAEARKKRGTAAGKKATAKRKAPARSLNPNRQIDIPKKGSDRYWADASRSAKAPGRRTSASGKVYYERRANRSDVPGTFAGSTNLSDLGFREIGMLAKQLDLWSDQKLSSLARNYFGYLDDFGFNRYSGNVWLQDEDYNVLIDNGNELDLFISTPYEGREGFFEDLVQEFAEMHPEDQDYMYQLWNSLPDVQKKKYQKFIKYTK